MPYTDGNLALKKKRETIGQPKKPTSVKKRYIPVSATPNQDEIFRLHARAVRRELRQRRFRMLAGMVSLVLFVAGIFGLIVYRQAQILEMNFETVAMEKQINQYLKESSQIRESLAQKTNLDEIRKQAESRLGLQDPARSQVVTVHIPDMDRVVFATWADSEESDQASLARVFSSIEAFFKTFHPANPGP